MKNRIKKIRKEKGLTQQELAKRLNVSRAAVSNFEVSDNVTTATLERIAAALGCYVHELIETEETKDGLLTFDNPEEFEAYRQSMLKNIEDLERSKLDIIIENASKLNDTGILLLSAISHILSTTEELTKDGQQVKIDEIETDGGKTEEGQERTSQDQ